MSIEMMLASLEISGNGSLTKKGLWNCVSSKKIIVVMVVEVHTCCYILEGYDG